MEDPKSKLPNRLIIVAGTYDGVLAGWDNVAAEKASNDTNDNEEKETATDEMRKQSLVDENSSSYLKMNFAMSVHEGSVRSLSIASSQQEPQEPNILVSTGYDDTIGVFSLTKQKQSGEFKTPSNLGTPTCSDFAPPSFSNTNTSPTHVILGLSCGKIIIYRRKDWSVQHVLSGHSPVDTNNGGGGGGGVTCLAVHPSGKMALSAGRDSKLCLWDLMRGRLAFVSKIRHKTKKKAPILINHMVWSKDGNRYAYCTHDGTITVREMATGTDLLDISLPIRSRANQLCFIGGNDGLFLAAGCNDGSLPVFVVGNVDDNQDEEEEEEDDGGVRRALMAIEPVDIEMKPTTPGGGVSHSVCDDRFKCIQSINGRRGDNDDFLVVTANSGGVISVIDLEGAARMLLADDEEKEKDDEDDYSKDSNDELSVNEDEYAAEILETVRIGSGARITSIAVWSSSNDNDIDNNTLQDDEDTEDKDEEQIMDENENDNDNDADNEETKKRKFGTSTAVPIVGSKGRREVIEMDSMELEKARALVKKAKKRQKRKSKKSL